MKKGIKSGNNNKEDSDLWQLVARSVRPLGKKPPPQKPPAPKRQPAAEHKTPLKPPKPAIAAARYDRGEEEALRKGKRDVEARLDLHGMTQGEAYEALNRAIRSAERSGKRTLLVITGKGKAGGGVLRRMLPLWLDEFRPAVLAYSQARPEDGGAGAFYVRLRKPKKP